MTKILVHLMELPWSANQGKGKGTVHPRTGYEGPEGELMYRFRLSLISAPDGVDGQRHIPAALPQERPGAHWIVGC